MSNIDEIYVVTSRRQLISIWFSKRYSKIWPKGYTPWLPNTAYLLTDIEKVLASSKTQKIEFSQSEVFNEKVEQYLKFNDIQGPILTISIRNKHWEKAHWNLEKEEIDQLFAVVRKMLANNQIRKVLLIPDFENPYSNELNDLAGSFLSKNQFHIVPEASLSIRFRSSLASKSDFNICSTNGTDIYHLFSGRPTVFLNRDRSWCGWARNNEFGKVLVNRSNVLVLDTDGWFDSAEIIEFFSNSYPQLPNNDAE